MIKNVEVLELLRGSNSLIDSTIISLEISHGIAGTEISLEFQCRYMADFPYVSLKFSYISAFHFHQTQIDIEVPREIFDLKFFQDCDQSFYMSLDPGPTILPLAEDVANTQHSDDNFYIRAAVVEAFITGL